MITEPANLLLPLDGSTAADQAVPFARDIARRAGANIAVLHVFASMKALSAAADSDIEWTPNVEPRAAIRPPAAIRDSVQELESAGISVSVVGRLGDVAAQVVDEAKRLDDPWIIMTSIGSTGFRRTVMGTNAVQTVRNSTFPVLVVPSTASPRDGFGESLRAVAVLLDGSEEAEAAIPVACAASKLLDGTLDVVRVAETMEDRRPDDLDRTSEALEVRPMVERVQAYCDDVRDRCEQAGASARSIPLSGSPEVQIQRYVQDNPPAMVVFVTRRRSGIERWTYGSFAEKLVDALPAPTLLVPIDQSDPAARR